MVQDWLIEIAKGIGKIFLNPLLYWAIIFSILIGIKRIKQERKYFGIKVYDLFSEWKETWGFSILIGIFYSILFLAVGMVLSYEVIWILSIVTILLSLIFRFTLLSPSYTVGVTIIIVLLAPQLSEYVPISGDVHLSVLAILLALFLFVEAHFLNRIKEKETFPALTLGERGSWVGKHWIKKFTIIPLFTLVPSGLIESFADYWPFLSVGDGSFSIVLIPFVLGFEFAVRGSLPHIAAQKLSMKLLGLAVIVLALAIGSIYISWLTILVVVVAIVGREFILYRFRVEDNGKTPIFNPKNEGLTVLGVIPGSPADRLHILIGETVTKVNGQKVNSEKALYEALQQTGSFFKIELIDHQGEIRFVQSALYEGDHHELGLIFTSRPYRKK